MQNERTFSGVFPIIKGAAIALALSLFLAVVFAAVLRVASLPQKAVYPVNQVIKILAVALGVFTAVRGEKGWIKGSIIGLVYTALSYLTFSAIGGDFSLSWLIITELLAGVLTGTLCGMIAVNIKN